MEMEILGIHSLAKTYQKYCQCKHKSVGGKVAITDECLGVSKYWGVHGLISKVYTYAYMFEMRIYLIAHGK